MPLEEQILSPDSSPFTIRYFAIVNNFRLFIAREGISCCKDALLGHCCSRNFLYAEIFRHFVSTIRGKNFSRCWPFPQRILERCLILGMKVELPPLEPPLNGHSCNISAQMPLNEHSEKVMSCGCSHQSPKGDLTNFDSEDSLEVLKDPATKKVFLGDTEVLNLAEKRLGVDMREHFPSIQNRDRAVTTKPSAKSFWDDNAVSGNTCITSKSDSQMVVNTLPDIDASSNLAGLVITGESGLLHAESDYAAVMEVPDCGLFQVVQEDSCAAHTSHSGEPVEPCNTHSIHSNQGVVDSLQPSTFGITYHDNRESLTTGYQPVVPLAEVEPMVCSHKTAESKNTEDLGLLRSNSDASMLQVCPVCLKFSSTSNTALNAHIDHCLVIDEAGARPSKKRFKVKKMRSMIDIYTWAPACTLEDLETSSQIWSFHKA